MGTGGGGQCLGLIKETNMMSFCRILFSQRDLLLMQGSERAPVHQPQPVSLPLPPQGDSRVKFEQDRLTGEILGRSLVSNRIFPFHLNTKVNAGLKFPELVELRTYLLQSKGSILEPGRLTRTSILAQGGL